jgi:hypothetical protein
MDYNFSSTNSMDLVDRRQSRFPFDSAGKSFPERTFIQIGANGGFEPGLNIRYGKIDCPFS